MIILSYKGTAYTLKNLANQKIHTVHVSRLEVFKYDVAHVDPQAVAAKDIGEFVVEEIRAHLPLHQPYKHKSALEFQVKWRGYGEDEVSWVKWRELNNNNICHAYCMNHGMKSLVPKSYRAALGV